MITFGPISSFFDCLSFVALYLIFGNSPAHFQTGWFMESLATQTLVIHFIRTKQIPFVQSWPSKQLLMSTFFVVILGWIIPFSPVGTLFGFAKLPLNTTLLLGLIVVFYLCTVEVMKRFFFKKYFNLI
jgi:Mg2+-importing ATPase